jgi:AraC-like DNA-binding protein
MVSALDEIEAVRRLLARLPGVAGIGVDVGSRFTLTHFGLFGFAVMSCATLRQLFSISMRYFALTMMHIDLQLFETADDCLIELDASHLPSDVQGFFIERDLAGIIATTTSFALPLAAKYAEQVSGGLGGGRGAAAAAAPTGTGARRQVRPGAQQAAFPAGHVRRAAAAGRSPHTGNVHGECDVLMQSSERRRGITALVRSKLFRDSGVFSTLPDVADELDIHPRTLRRRLAKEGTSFRALRNEARSAVAVDLLRNVGLTVEEVPTRLGYTEVSTFLHAFKRWHGVAPSAYSRRGP